jgi:flagellin
MGISEKMRSQIISVEMATRNTHDAISLIQTADGGMQGIQDLVHRMRELVVFAANDTNTLSDRQVIQVEIDNLMQELDQMTHRVQFNTREILRGTGDAPVATAAEGAIPTTALAQLAAAVDISAASFSDSFVALAPTQMKAEEAQKVMDIARFNVLESFNDFLLSEALAALAKAGGKVGALAVELTAFVADFVKDVESVQSTEMFMDIVTKVGKGVSALDMPTFSTGNPSHRANYDTLQAKFKNISEFNKAFVESVQVSDTELAALQQTQYLIDELGEQFKLSLEAYSNYPVGSFEASDIPMPTQLQDADPLNAALRQTLSLHFQVGPNSGHSAILLIDPIDSHRLGIGNGSGVPNFTVALERGEEISALLQDFDFALNHISMQRGKMGAMQNRMEFVIDNLGVTVENLSNARSRIADADMAIEVMNSAKANIIAQAAMSMLAQANQAPNAIMQLLQ